MNNEPVAWMVAEMVFTIEESAIEMAKVYCDDVISLYTNPVELTDEEIISTMVQFDVYSNDDQCLIEAGRAILRKAQSHE